MKAAIFGKTIDIQFTARLSAPFEEHPYHLVQSVLISNEAQNVHTLIDNVDFLPAAWLHDYLPPWFAHPRSHGQDFYYGEKTKDVGKQFWHKINPSLRIFGLRFFWLSFHYWNAGKWLESLKRVELFNESKKKVGRQRWSRKIYGFDAWFHKYD